MSELPAEQSKQPPEKVRISGHLPSAPKGSGRWIRIQARALGLESFVDVSTGWFSEDVYFEVIGDEETILRFKKSWNKNLANI